MITNLIGIKLIRGLYNVIVWTILLMIYLTYFFIFWGKYFFLLFGIIILLLNLYILKRTVLTLRGYTKVVDLLDEYFFLLFSNIRVFGQFISGIFAKLTNKSVKPFTIQNIKHTNRLNG